MLRHWLWIFFLWLPFAILFVVAWVFLRRRIWRQLPFFSLYLVSALVIGALREISERFGEWPHFYTFWISDMAGAVFVFAAMYEVFLRRMFPRFHQTRFYRLAFPVAAGLVFFLTVATALQAPDKGAAILMASRAYDFARAAILVFFIALMLLMGRQWNRYDLGITLGLAIQSAVALVSSAARTRMHYHATVFDTIEVISYNVACLIWLITFWKREQRLQVGPLERLDPEVLNKARAWESLLKKWLTPQKNKRQNQPEGKL